MGLSAKLVLGEAYDGSASESCGETYPLSCATRSTDGLGLGRSATLGRGVGAYPENGLGSPTLALGLGENPDDTFKSPTPAC